MKILDLLEVNRDDIVFVCYVRPKKNGTNCYKGISYIAEFEEEEWVRKGLVCPNENWPLVILAHRQLAAQDLSKYAQLLSGGLNAGKIYMKIPEEICSNKELRKKYAVSGPHRY